MASRSRIAKNTVRKKGQSIAIVINIIIIIIMGRRLVRSLGALVKDAAAGASREQDEEDGR
jgi:hypothetical protein